MTGMTVDGRWLGSFNTKAPQHSFCIDGFKGYPRASYSWRLQTINAPRASYLLWRFGSNPNTNEAAALSWIVHASNEIGHQNAAGYTNLPKSALPAAVRNKVNQMQSLATRNVGPYRLILNMKNQVNGNRWAHGTVKLVGRHGRLISDNFGNRNIRVTLNNGEFGNGASNRTFYLANGSGSFQYRRSNSSVQQIGGQATVNYGPVKVRRWVPNVSSAQRVVARMAGDSISARNSTRVIEIAASDNARVVLTKHGQAPGQLSEPAAGAVFALTQSQDAPVPGQGRRESTGVMGHAVFSDLKTNHTYWVHEISPPAGYALPTPNDPVRVVTGGNNSTVQVRGGQPIINRQATFDLALRKYIHAVSGQATGQTGREVAPAPTRVDVGDVVDHRIVVFNQGQTAGTAEQIIDYIPESYDFAEELNPNWTYDEVTRTATLSTGEHYLEADPTPGQVNGDEPSFMVSIFLRVNAVIYTSGDPERGKNFAEICEDSNDFDYPDIDSVPDCDKSNDIIGGDNIVDNTNDDEDDHDFDEIAPAALEVSTQATSQAKTGTVIGDSLISTKPLPGGLNVIFRAYSTDACDTDPIYVSDPVMTVAGQVRVGDPGFTAKAPGRYFWVGSVASPDGTIYYQGQCGDAGEISNVYKITTTATPSKQLGGRIRDTAHVEGDLPEGSKLRFVLYGPYDSTCENDPAFISDTIPTVTDRAEYVSGKFKPHKVGSYLWVEELISEDEQSVFTRGKCGAENETSQIWNVNTVATTTAKVGGKIRDTASVTGKVPVGSTIRFKLFGPGDENCRKPVFVSDPQPVDGPGFYRGQKYTPKKPGKHYWVEELINPEGEVIARGICGLKQETSHVSDVPEDPDTPPDTPTPPVVDVPVPVTG